MARAERPLSPHLQIFRWYFTMALSIAHRATGIALADEPLRAEIRRKFPEAWQRIEARRSFMKDVLGIELKPEVLPFSNIPAYLPPFLLSPRRVMTVVREATS